MYKVRIHGRGGQGAKTAAKLIGMAAYLDGMQSQAFSIYGAERRGAPVTAFVRIDDKEILERGYIHDPDCVIVLDDTLIGMKEVGVFNGVKPGGKILVNTKRKIPFKGPKGAEVLPICGTDVALEIFGKPIFNTVMIGPFIRVTGKISMDSERESILHLLGRRKRHLIEQNLRAIRKCYDLACKLGEKK